MEWRKVKENNFKCIIWWYCNIQIVHLLLHPWYFYCILHRICIGPLQVNTMFPSPARMDFCARINFFIISHSLFDGFPEFFDSKLFYAMIKRVSIWFSQLQFRKMVIFYLDRMVCKRPHQFLHYFTFYSLFDGFPEFFDSKLFYTMIKRVSIWFSQLQFRKIFIFYLHNYLRKWIMNNEPQKNSQSTFQCMYTYIFFHF